MFLFRALVLLCIILFPSFKPDWGFYAHRKINRFAVYSLPDPLFEWYKKQQHYIEKHAVDADMRRYAVRAEALFHFFDLDIYSDSVQDLAELGSSRWKYSRAFLYSQDSLVWLKGVGDSLFPNSMKEENQQLMLHKLSELVMEDNPIVFEWSDSPAVFRMEVVDSFSKHGLLPFRILTLSRSLELAFLQQDIDRILRISADLGHYVGDAHVPLHTTENYNGQLTGQTGIHGFWESRLPELFLHKKYFLNIRPARYIHDLSDEIWRVIQQSHALVEKVLECERSARASLRDDQIMCYDERSGRFVWQPCQLFAESYNECLGDMVWRRWEDAIHFLGSVWLTAWANAGEPFLDPEYDKALYSQSSGTDSLKTSSNLVRQLSCDQ